jgi:hypothetical protein
MVKASLGMTGISFWAYVAPLPVEVSDWVAAGLLSLEDVLLSLEDAESVAGADEGFVPFPLAAGVPDFLA